VERTKGVAALFVALSSAGCGSAFTEVSDSPAGAYEASLATLVDGLVVAWYDTRDGHAEIYARLLDEDGRPSGPERRLTHGRNDAYEADVQALPDALAVGWYEETSDPRLIPRLGVWTRDGTPRWIKTLATTGRNTVVRTRGETIFAAWLQDEGSDRAGLWAGWWRADGNELVAPARIADAGKTTWNLNAAIDPSITGDDLHAWVAFDAKVGTTSEELFLAEVTGAGARVVRLTGDDGHASKYPDLAFAGTRVTLTWFDARDGNGEVYLFAGARNQLQRAGAIEGRRITNTPGHSIGAYLAWNGDRIGLAWCDDSEGQQELYFQPFDSAGAPLADARRLTRTAPSSLIPAIRPWREGFALAWNEYDAPPGEGHDVEARSQIAVTLIQ
jgi:hypothetical protein